MNSFEEKKQSKIDRLREAARKAREESDKAYKAAKQIGDMIPMGQPILVGHHSHQELFDEFLQRRVNIIKAFVAQFNTGLKEAANNIEIEPVITPYMDQVRNIAENL